MYVMMSEKMQAFEHRNKQQLDLTDAQQTA
jgi:hypothetical protein